MPHYSCRRCGKSFATDNAWLWADAETDTVRAYFCGEACRTAYVGRAAELAAAGTRCPMCKAGLKLDAAPRTPHLACAAAAGCGYRRG